MLRNKNVCLLVKEFNMICNYQNITDYCLNKFSYQYTTTPTSASGDLVTSVIRTDKDTGQKITISSDTDLFIEPCDNNDLVEVISYWECYAIYVNNGNVVNSPDLLVTNTLQTDSVLKNYDNSLQDGVSISIDSYNTIILDGTIENQIHLSNVICLANILYNENTNSAMPYILDINNTAYYLNYSTLKLVLTKYFETVSKQKVVKDDLLNQLQTIKTSDDISNKYYCNNKTSQNIIQSNIVIDYSTYQEISDVTTGVCDPPCDSNSCETCVDGQCVSLCDSGECCDDGVCVAQCQRTICVDSGTCSVVSCDDCNCPPGYSCGGSEGSYGCFKTYVVPGNVTDCVDYLGFAPFSNWSGPSTQNGTCVNGQCEYT